MLFSTSNYKRIFNMSKAKVIEKNSGETLFECSVDDIDKAYQYALEMEEIGLDIEVVSPSAPETLAKVLGASDQELQKLQTVLKEEIEDHEPDSCCFTPSPKSPTLTQ